MTDDPMDSPDICPECGALLRPVGVKTVKHLLRYPLARSLSDGRFLYCPDRECDLVYLRFAAENSSDTPDETFRSDDIKERARLQASEDDRFVCYCFGYTMAEIRNDAHSGSNSIPAAIAAEVRAGNCACEVMNPGGT